MSSKSPAARIAAKFPTRPCILLVKDVKINRPGGLVSMGTSILQVLEVRDRRPVEPRMVATVFFNGEVRELTRNFGNEDNPNTLVDPFTMRLLDECEMELLPTSGYVADVVRNVVNEVKDGLVDRSVEATQAVGEVRAALDALKVRVDSLPVAGDYRQMEKDFAAIKLLAGNVEERLANALKAAETLQAQRESRQQAQFDAQASRMAALEQQVKAQAALLNGLVQTLEANTAPAPETEHPAQATPATPTQAPTQSDPVAVYSAKLSGMSVVTQLYAEYGKFGLPKPKTGTSMAEMRTQLAKAFAERQTQA